MTEAKKKANKKYDEKFKQIKFRVTEEQQEIIKENAKKENKSIREYILDKTLYPNK